MKKKGFTLAEVLITLTVIGIVAAITLPSLTTNVQKAQTGSTLAKAINSLESFPSVLIENDTLFLLAIKTSIIFLLSKKDSIVFLPKIYSILNDSFFN